MSRVQAKSPSSDPEAAAIEANNYFTIDRVAVTINDALRSDFCTNP